MRKRWKEGGVRNEGKRGHLGEFEFEIWAVHALTSPHSNPPPHLKHLLNSSISLFNNAMHISWRQREVVWNNLFGLTSIVEC